MTPRRTTESFTLHRVWLYQRSVQALTKAGTSTVASAGNLISRCVAYGYAFVSGMLPPMRMASPISSSFPDSYKSGVPFEQAPLINEAVYHEWIALDEFFCS